MKHILATALLLATTWYAAPAAADTPLAYDSQAYAINDAGDIVGAVLIPGAGAPPSYAAKWDRNNNLTRLDAPPGLRYPRAFAINAAGLVAGSAVSDGGVVGDRLLRWDQRGRVTAFASAAIGNLQVAGISDAGVIAASALIEESAASTAMRTDDRGRLAPLPVLPGGVPAYRGDTVSVAADINRAGTIVGTSRVDDTDSHAVRWDSAGVHDLGTLPGDLDSSAAAINATGSIVGQSFGPRSERAVRWDPGGQITELGSLPSGTSSSAVDINDYGVVTGSATDNTGRVHAVRWDPAGRITDLGAATGPGSSRTWAVAINLASTVIGGQDSPRLFVALRWDSAGRQHDLPLVPDAEGAAAMAINSAGTVVGVMIFSAGGSRAVRWTVAGLTILPLASQHQPHPTGTR